MNGDLRGFEPQEIEVMALVARYHRRGLPKRSHGGYGDLSGTRRRTVRTLAAMLRVAEGLDRSHAQSVAAVAVVAGAHDCLLKLTPAGDTELELWAAQRNAGPLESVLGRIVRCEVDAKRRRQPGRGATAAGRRRQPVPPGAPTPRRRAAARGADDPDASA